MLKLFCFASGVNSDIFEGLSWGSIDPFYQCPGRNLLIPVICSIVKVIPIVGGQGLKHPRARGRGLAPAAGLRVVDGFVESLFFMKAGASRAFGDT